MGKIVEELRSRLLAQIETGLLWRLDDLNHAVGAALSMGAWSDVFRLFWIRLAHGRVRVFQGIDRFLDRWGRRFGGFAEGHFRALR